MPNDDGFTDLLKILLAAKKSGADIKATRVFPPTSADDEDCGDPDCEVHGTRGLLSKLKAAAGAEARPGAAKPAMHAEMRAMELIQRWRAAHGGVVAPPPASHPLAGRLVREHEGLITIPGERQVMIVWRGFDATLLQDRLALEKLANRDALLPMDPIDVVCGYVSEDGSHMKPHFASSRELELWDGEAEILRMLAPGAASGEGDA